ncbi:bifunctional serine/threonine-protein kinase/formylglycine-generating enzyme family protein [Leptolyngbya sp. NIES-2104]|uniref:bifunctional serine/threonine-protein kinase/formylglycine-generating enzyme family protein n=1 Tax=Leptolyngbya sp. NIES-2104 TaxID=1552121 RepID=UPI0006EC8627|nr:bifunctional serine/threonine-protein kinase/formylglycine-generating enzyme family protein [Leptolyngbya sp. NIES-2104]GAP96774.1 serine/threonine kinase [Leptolyngbya sp. NIES-2104]
MAWNPGQQIKQGKYQIIKKLGEGGFGITYLARDTSGRSIVIKTPTDRVLNHPNAKKLLNDFLNEALKLARFQHPNVVNVIEVIRDDPQDAIVMEYVEGQSLKDILNYYGVLPEAKALKYIQQIGQALTIVHAQGLLHRDIKPDNIIVRSHTDEAVLIDFGIARGFKPGSTQTDTPNLTPGYAPFEQYNEPAQRGPYTDVYALAATLYELVTGQLPIEALGRAVEFARYKSDSLRSPKSINPKISDRTNRAILKGLAIKANDRPQTMQVWLNLLEPPVVISPAKPLVKPSINRQQFLKLIGFGGGSLLLTVGGKSLWDSISKTSSIDLKDFSFEVVTINEQKGVQKETKQAKFFTENLGNGVLLEMVAIPGGTFPMGSPTSEKDRENDESPQRTVTVSAFFLGRYEVTQAQYEAIMGNNPSTFKGRKRPVEQITWNDAQEFCQKLNQRTGRKYRLPSEAEWEYACRAGTTTMFHFGASIDVISLANYGADQPKKFRRDQTTDVGSFPANAFGLHDMHGNVWEWCEDTYHASYQNAPIDGSAWISDNKNVNRLRRGGSWLNPARYCRSAFRGNSEPNYRDGSFGFRVACTI